MVFTAWRPVSPAAHADATGRQLRVEHPTGSGRLCTLQEIANDLSLRLSTLFLRDRTGRRACHGDEARYQHDPHWRDLVLFYEYFDGDTGRGAGANHQTGWSALVARCIEKAIRRRGPV